MIEMFTADGDLILKIKIRSPKQSDLEHQDQITILILRSQSDLEDPDDAHLWFSYMLYSDICGMKTAQKFLILR